MIINRRHIPTLPTDSARLLSVPPALLEAMRAHTKAASAMRLVPIVRSVARENRYK